MNGHIQRTVHRSAVPRGAVPSRCTRHPGRWLLVPLWIALGSWVAAPAWASPFGTQYTASVSNFPGSDTAVLSFDGLEEPLGTSGLIVGENATPYVDFELLEFSLATANGQPFVGQQVDPLAVASVSVLDLHWFGDPNPVQALSDGAFLWLAIDGVAQPLSDPGGFGFGFSTHPFDPSIPIVVIDNLASTTLGFDTFGVSALEAFAALVGPTLAGQIDSVHFGVAAAPIPEPGTAVLVFGGLAGLAAARRAVRGASHAA